MSNVGEKFQLSRDEFRNITRCLEQEEFRKLFAEYCEDLSNPENRRQYEEELKILEAERGYDVQFIKPLPGYVIKTTVDGRKKAFVNVCHCDLIGKPASQCLVNEKDEKGLQWSIPYAQSQPRKDYDNRKNECVVYDVVFHFDTLHLANRNTGFRKLVSDTAIDAVEKAFGVSLDKASLKFPKLQYKGVPKMTVIRSKAKECRQKDCFIDNTYLPSKKQEDTNGNKENIGNQVYPESSLEGDYVSPFFKLIHRKEVEYHEMTEELDAKLDVTIPKELVLVIELPLLKSAADCALNVTSEELHLISEKPAKYKLEVKLPYDVSEKDGSAKFSVQEKTLTVTLPVIKKRRMTLNDINSMNRIASHTTKNADISMETEVNKKSNEPAKLLKGPQVISNNASKRIIFPKFSANRMDNIFAFTLNVRNVDPSSIELQKGSDSVSCRFTNVGNGFFPCYYVFFVRFPNASIADVQHEQWDNNMILQVVLDSSQIDCYYAGANENDLVQYSIMEDITDKIDKFGKEIEDDSLCIAVSKNATKQERKSSHLSIEIKTKDDTDADDDEDDDLIVRRQKTDQPSKNEQSAVNNNEHVENSTSREMEMKLSYEEDAGEKQEAGNETKKSKKNSRRKNKKRSLSESCCDQLKVIVENEISKRESNIDTDASSGGTTNKNEVSEVTSLVKQRKARSVSESCTSISSPTDGAGADSASIDNLTALIHFNRKYKGILKRSSFERSISECSSVDDHSYLATSVDGSSMAGSVEQAHGELSESSRKTVRFNDFIKTKIFRSNTSILAQKKKNAKKNESKRRSLTRRLSEGESTDNDDKDHGNGDEAPVAGLQTDHEHDSGISLDSDAGNGIEKENESDIQNQLLVDSTKPIDINHNVGKNVANNKKEDNNSKTSKSSHRKSTKRYDSIDIDFKSDMIFDIEM